MVKTFLSQLSWRHATKKFDKNKKVSQEKLDKIIEAIRMTPTSLGLQIFHFYVVEKDEVKTRLAELSYNQSQVSDASHVFVMCYRTDASQRLKEYVDLVTRENLVSNEKIDSMKKMMSGYLSGRSNEDAAQWAAKQVYIALGFAMAACAELEVDSCPMEGFQPDKVDELLQFPENHKSVLLLPIGYRAEAPKKKKIRFPKEELFTFI